MNEETRFIIVDSSKIRLYTSFTKKFEDTTKKPVVLFFHGFSFSIDDWGKIGALKEVRGHGFQVVAIDLPRGNASKSDKIELKEISEYNSILERILSQLGILQNKKLVIVGPSMGGGFALSFAFEHPEPISGLVLVAPSLRQIPEKSIKYLDSGGIPILLVWGDKDDVFPVEDYAKPLQSFLPRSKLAVLSGARHPAYLDKPEEFQELLLNFLDEVTGLA
ncbi:MAG: alpha/beta fold hydrolase [Nitrososphaerales archaeon]